MDKQKDQKVAKEFNLILNSAVTSCVSISAFASLVGIPIEITSSAATIKFA